MVLGILWGWGFYGAKIFVGLGFMSINVLQLGLG